jgi:hypothetical protein
MVFVTDFIKDIYESFNLDYLDYIEIDSGSFKEYKKTKEYYLKSNIFVYSYEELLSDTINDLNIKL